MQVVSRSQAGEDQKVADQMRLVKIPMFHRQLSPIRLGNSVHEMQDTLKPLNAVEQLGLQTHLKSEYIDEPPIAEARISGQFANYRP